MQEWEFRTGRRLELPESDHLTVRVIGGGVHVTSAPGRPVLEVTKVSGGALLVTHADGRLSVRHDQGYHRPWYRDLPPVRRRRCQLALSVPAGTTVEVQTVGAEVIAAGLTGTTSLTTLNGSIVVDRVGGHLDVRSVTGELLARDCAGAAQLNSVSGEVTVAATTADLAATVVTVSGGITFSVPTREPLGYDIALATSAGAVRTALPDDTPGLTGVTDPTGRVVGLHLNRAGSAGTLRVRAETVSGPVCLTARGELSAAGSRRRPDEGEHR